MYTAGSSINCQCVVSTDDDPLNRGTSRERSSQTASVRHPRGYLGNVVISTAWARCYWRSTLTIGSPKATCGIYIALRSAVRPYKAGARFSAQNS